MKLTGFADEAGQDFATQIKATQELGWQYISARGIDGVNIHDLSESAFSEAVEQLDHAGLKVAEIGSLIGTWAKTIHTDFAVTLGEVERCIQRMQMLDTKIVRVMSYAQEPWGQEQYVDERVRRLREIVTRFTDAGLIVAHENCMNYGGFSAQHTLELLEKVPGLKLIFDTGNPVFQRDRSMAEPQAWQDAWQFYQEVKNHVVHVHIKDCLNPLRDGEEPEYVFPGLGQGYVKEILSDLQATNYRGFVAIEPHVATVFHAESNAVDWAQCYQSYVAYGRSLEKMMG